jgi:hypothetical protein
MKALDPVLTLGLTNALRQRRDSAIARAAAIATDSGEHRDPDVDELRLMSLMHTASTLHGYAELVDDVALESVHA